VTDPAYIVKCREEWEKKSNNGIVEYIVVPRLPRDASVEWCVWVTHVSSFPHLIFSFIYEKLDFNLITGSYAQFRIRV